MVKEEELPLLKVKFTHLPNTKQFKELYKALEKDNEFQLTIKRGLLYPLQDADKIIQVLQEFISDPRFVASKKDRLYISFELRPDNGGLAYVISNYSLDNSSSTVKEIVSRDLDTQYLDPKEFDEGKSDFNKEKELLKERIEKSYGIESSAVSKNVSVTKQKPSLFSRVLNRNKKEDDKKIEEIEKTVNTNNGQDIDTTQPQVAQHESKPVENVTKRADTPQMKVVDEVKNIEKPNQQDKTEEKQIKHDKPIEKETTQMQQQDKKPQEQTVVENKQQPSRKETKRHQEYQSTIIIPKLEYEKPEISLLTGNYVSKAVQEYLNEVEYERVLEKNKKIEDYNNEIQAYYLSLQKEFEEKLKQHEEEKQPSDEDLKNYIEEEQGKLNVEIEAFENSIQSKNESIIAERRTQLDLRLEKIKDNNKSKIEQYKKELAFEEKEYEDQENATINELEKTLEKEESETLSEHSTELRNASRQRINSERQKHIDAFYYQREQFKRDLTQNMVQSLKEKFELYSNDLSENTHDAHVSKLKSDIQKIKTNAERHHEKVEKEKSKQATELTRQKELELKDIDVRKLREEKERQLAVQHRIEAENRERDLKLQEKRQADDHVARMKELELKYLNPKADKKEQSTISRFMIGAVTSLIGLILLVLVGAYLIFSPANTDSYESLLNDGNYTEIAEHYPEKLNELSETLYRNEDSKGLETLSQASNDEVANFRYQLLNNDKKNIINAYENLTNKQNIKDNERLRVVQAYMDNNQFEEARELNQTLNDREINKQLAEIEYYKQLKTDLENVVEKSKDKDEVKKAEQELEQVNMILGE